MNSNPPLYRSDIRPLEFTLAVILGGIGSAVLSGLRVHPVVSVGFAITVMGGLAFLRWRAASEFKDFESLEAFAEDIYLLGYLLTLAALLGLAPRLMSDEANLFSIAGLKLVTTVIGLALMMIFRQTARRWAQEAVSGANDSFISQQKQFSDAVARLNQGADELTSKLSEVINRFDPDLLVPVAEWSNRAAGAFNNATKAMEAASPAIERSADRFQTVASNLERVQTAATGLAGILATDATQAARGFGTEMVNASRAVHGLGGSISCLQPAGEAARVALEGLGNQATQSSTQFNAIHASLNRTALELGKVELALKKVAEINSADLNGPLNKVAQGLEVSAAKTAASTQSMEGLKQTLQTNSVAGENLAQRIESSVGKPLVQNQQTIEKVQQQVARAGDQLQQVAKQLETVATAGQQGSALTSQLLSKLDSLQSEMKETNTHIKNLVTSIDASLGNGEKPGMFSWLKGNRETRNDK